MAVLDSDIAKNLEVHLLGCNGEMEILPVADDELCTSYLPCGLPPILPDTVTILKSFTQDIEKLPILQLDAVQRIVPMKPNASTLYSPKVCPLPTELVVKHDMTTGKVLGFVEKVKESVQGTTKTSTSLLRAPGLPDLGVRGSTSNFPFWPGGMDEPLAKLISQEPLNSSLFDGEYLDTPPGFKEGMKFERKCPVKSKIPLSVDKIRLADVLSMDDLLDLESLEEEDDLQHTVALDKLQGPAGDQADTRNVNEDMLRIANMPVLKISETETSENDLNKSKYKWAVIEDVSEPISEEYFHAQIPTMAYNWPFELDIFQKKAILFLEKHENVFIAAHTSAGKTVIAEYAIALAKKHMTRVIYTSPIKALSNQKFRDFKEVFEDVGLITGDVQLNPSAFCLIMTTEILRSMLYHGSDVVREVEWVIFDEVHYINDAERGVVWEEVFIMLPSHVNLIMLSATVPNTAEFAEWLGAIKKRKIHVISTLKRPVPLEYYLYTGSVGKTQDENFLVVNKTGKFQDHMYKKAVAVKNERQDKSKTGPGSRSYYGNISYEKNIYIGLLGYLKRHVLLPVVCFTLSRKKCKEHAESLQSQDLTTAKEKDEIIRFFRRSISKLKKEDKELIQIKTMERQLSLGFGVHHSGILPLLKEVVEMLFQRGLIKVLFATETFAMGVNMPARTVVFDSIQKHDGKERRDLKPSEFIQMAGRAGRRGLDKTGTVIILCKNDVPNIISLQHMMLGKPTKLESQFKLTYSMILNLLKVKTLRVEDVMKRSFGESHSQKLCEDLQTELLDAKEKLSKLSKPDCSLCNTDLEQYCVTVAQIKELSSEALEKLCLQAIRSRQLNVGRVVTVITSYHSSVPGLILSVDRDNKCKVLVIDNSEVDGVCDIPWTKKPYFPDARRLALLSVFPREIHVISNNVLTIEGDSVVKDWNRMKGLNCEPGRDIRSAFDSLIDYCESHRESFPNLNMNLKDFQHIDKHLRFKQLNDSLQRFMCLRCPEFSKHFKQFSEILHLQADIDKFQYQMSEESLLLHSEFEARKDVLKAMNYITDSDDVQLKGSVAREMSNHELLITELLVKSLFTDCAPEEIVALLSCTVFQQKSHGKLSNLGLSNDMLKKIGEIQEVIADIDKCQNKYGVQEAAYADQYNFHLSHVVYDWAKGVSFAKIMQNEKVDVEEGIIVRCIQRLSELLKEVRKAASLVGDTVLAKKMEDASTMIKRDIVFAVSLYTQQS